MELSQGVIIQKPKMQELSSLDMTHRLIVMYAPVKFHEYIPEGFGVVFLVHDTSAQCHACTCIVS